MAKYISNKTHNQKDQTDHQLTPQKSSYSQPYSKYTKTYPTEHLNSSSKTNSHTPPTSPLSSTGFGYDDTVKLNYLRGRQIREVKAHVKTEVLIGVRGKKKIVLGVEVGKAYF